MKANLRLQFEAHARRLEPLGKGVKGLHLQHDSEVWDGYIVAVDVALAALTARRAGGTKVCDDLVAEQVEVDPVGRAAAFFAAKDLAVEVTRAIEIGHGKRYVERS